MTNWWSVGGRLLLAFLGAELLEVRSSDACSGRSDVMDYLEPAGGDSPATITT